MITKGQQVFIKPEWQDAGDEKYVWVALADEDKGRVKIAPVNTGLAIPPSSVVNVEWLQGA